MEKEDQIQRTKELFVWLGSSVKLVSPICGLISERKNGGQFLYPEKDHTRGRAGGLPPGGSKGSMVKDHKFSDFFSRPLP